MQNRHTLQLQIAQINKASSSIRMGVGSASQLAYDGFGRLSQIKLNSPNQQTLLQRQYQYDPISNITRIDALPLPIRQTLPPHQSGLPDEQYSYDKLGNRLTDNGKPNPAAANKQWQYNGNNQLTQSATEYLLIKRYL